MPSALSESSEISRCWPAGSLTLSEACGEAGAYVHWGATTQDIMNTGLILQLRQAVALLEERMLSVRDAWRELAIRYRDTLMPGRTHGQHGPPKG